MGKRRIQLNPLVCASYFRKGSCYSSKQTQEEPKRNNQGV